MSLRGDAAAGRLILSADTICVAADGQLIGQPQTRADAQAMIEQFVERSHEVVTGCALLGPGDDTPETWTDAATVTFGALSAAALADYLDSGHWRGKAGAYNLFDRQAAGWPITVEGDATTVVGLPMRQLTARLAQRGVHPT